MSSVGSPKKISPNSGRDIPSRKIVVNDLSQLPYDYSSTPGGTLFSTTPGGTRIVYDRSFLMHLRNSPMAKSPPKNLPPIPGVTSPLVGKENKPTPKSPPKIGSQPTVTTIPEERPKPTIAVSITGSGGTSDEPQFDMDME